MQTSIIAIIGFIATAVSAVPTYDPPYVACPVGLYSNPQCCATDVLGVADLDCHSRELSPVLQQLLDVKKKLILCEQPRLPPSASATSATSAPTAAIVPAAALSLL